jgi:glycine betaine/proline transport system ATP-binding protein
MGKYDPSAEMSDITVSKDAIIGTVAESVLTEQKPVAVTDGDDKIVGVLNSSAIIHVLFGDTTSVPVNN